MKYIYLIFLLFMSFVLLSCVADVIDSKNTEVPSKVNTDKENNQAESNTTPTPNPNGNFSNEKASRCQPKNFLSANDSQDVGFNENISKPDSREAFDNWLKDLVGSVQVATLSNRKFINEYYWEGDLNGDGCEDIAIIVEGIKNASGKILMETSDVGTTVQNLRSKSIFNGGDKEKFPFSKDFATQIKPQSSIAAMVVFGGQNGWSWKQNAQGREFLLYDSIFKPAESADYEISSMLLFIVRKDKPEEDDDDLLHLFPSNAVGDCIYTATQTKRRKNKYSEMTNRFLICYDGSVFFNKKLPNSRSYPE